MFHCESVVLRDAGAAGRSECVQLHGGYGYVEEYSAERAYRDSRINKIFEGTNEINRLIISGWMMKRAMQGSLALLPAIQRVMDEVMAGPKAREERTGELAAQHLLLANAKKMTLFCAGAASEKFGAELAEQQEIMGALADMIIGGAGAGVRNSASREDARPSPWLSK